MALSSPGIIGTLAIGPRKVEEEDLRQTAHMLLLACSVQKRTGDIH